MITRIEHKYTIGQIVYLKTDIDQRPHMINGLAVDINNKVEYLIAQGGNADIQVREHEISDTADVMLKTSN